MKSSLIAGRSPSWGALQFGAGHPGAAAAIVAPRLVRTELADPTGVFAALAVDHRQDIELPSASGSPSAWIDASADGWRLFHDYVARDFKMSHDVVGGDIGHEFVALLQAPSPLESQREASPEARRNAWDS